MDLLDPDDNLLCAVTLTSAAPDPLTDVEVAATCPDLTFTRPGVYRLRVTAAGELLTERRLTVRNMAVGAAP
jgi:hypothetical protein